jgi:hypothetical protein
LESPAIEFNTNFFRVEIPTEKRVKRWAIAMEELVLDPTGKYFVS